MEFGKLRLIHVRFTPKSGHSSAHQECLLCATTRHLGGRCLGVPVSANTRATGQEIWIFSSGGQVEALLVSHPLWLRFWLGAKARREKASRPPVKLT
jgi:hypothetical protein